MWILRTLCKRQLKIPTGKSPVLDGLAEFFVPASRNELELVPVGLAPPDALVGRNLLAPSLDINSFTI